MTTTQPGTRGDPKHAADIMGTFFYRTAIAGEHPVAQPNMGIGAAVAVRVRGLCDGLV